MNKNIGMYCSIINVISVFLFALSMLIKNNFLSYSSSMFIALSFIPMVCSFCYYSNDNRKAAGYSAIAFAAIYGVFILAVYFAQLTVVRIGGLSVQAVQIIDYQKFGLFFNYDLLGYSIMGLATFFIGLTIDAHTKTDKWLRWLLIIHGISFISGLVIPMLGMFSSNAQESGLIGVAILESWCIYFISIGILSFLNFKHKQTLDK